MNLAGKRRVVLYAVVGQSEVYHKLGFKSTNEQMICISGFVEHRRLLHQNDIDFAVDKVTPDNVDNVTRFDEGLILAERSIFLKSWLLSEKSRSLCAVSTGGEVVGYIVVRPDHVNASPNSFQIRGFYANNITIAHELLRSAFCALPDKSHVWADFPNTNEASCLSIYKRVGFEKILPNNTLLPMVYGGEFPGVDLCKVFGINSSNTFI
jgi:predicted N-acetyltransferase YhbS